MLFGKNKQKDKPDNPPLEGVPQVHHHQQHVKNVAAISIVGLQTNPEVSNKNGQVNNNNNNDQQDFCVSMDDVPLSDEEKNRYYKFSKNVMASRKIRELIQANRLMTQQQQGGQRSSIKMTILFGLALSLQIIAVLLIFV